MSRKPTDEQILQTLESAFGYRSFRPLQENIVRAILDGQDVFVLMPTGGGKSLCYQLPALLKDGLTVVVSPLIALMKDQVDALEANGIAATYINSSLSWSEIGRRQAAVARGEVKLLYVAPERLMAPGFLQLLKSVPVAFFAIDEAHCISEWGHDFRPEYRELSGLRDLFPGTGLGAFTATATRRVQADIVDQLKLHNAVTFRGSFNRPNLYYDVRAKYAPDQLLIAYVEAHAEASGIVYCLSRAETERVASVLTEHGFSATAYHAGLGNEERKRRQEAFIKDDVRIIVATIAFGMGIDKPDVRFVVHYDLPKSLEGYFQESGRAGRDGDPSDCILLYSYADVAKQDYFIKQKTSPQEQSIAEQQLRQMADWADSGLCRRRALLAYFDETFDGQAGPCCDICTDPPELFDCTIPTQMLLSCIKRTGERFGMAYVIDILRGSQGERILRLGHDKLSTFGIGRDRPKEEWQQIARQLLQQRYIQQEGEYNVLTVTDRGHAVLFQSEPVFLTPVAVRAQRRAPVPQVEANPALFERLRSLRKRLADERELPPYVIFHDSALREMAARLPARREDFLAIAGVGEHKADAYGAPFLACIAAYVRDTGARPIVPPASPGAGAFRLPITGLGASARLTLKLFNEGQSVLEMATARGLAISTVEDHLVEAVETGELLDIDRLVSRERQGIIRAATVEVGSPPLLKPIRERLGDDYSYFEIRLVRPMVRRTFD